jgi:hypothetical protein
MKYLITLLAVAITFTASSQVSFTPKKSSGGGGVNISESTVVGSISIEGESFEVSALESGTKFIKCTSPRTGNDYPVWVYAVTEYEYEGHKVYQTKKGTYCIYRISKNTGNPYPQWLDANE